MAKTAKKQKSKTAILWVYKIASVLAALLIWVLITITQNPLDEVSFTISLEQRSQPESLILEKTVNQVQVRVQATAAVINVLTPADIAAYVDLGGLESGKHELEIMVEHPENVQVLSLRPANIEVELKEPLAQMFPLEVTVEGEPAPGYKQLEALLSPAEVKLTGVQDNLRRVARVYVDASIQGIEESYDKDLSVMVQDRAGNDISAMFSIEPQVARVVIPVLYEQPERMVAVRVAVTGEPALGYQLSLISATPAMVRVLGDLQRLQSLYYVDTEPVDISDLKTDTSRTVRLVPENGFTVYPREVTVAVRIEPVSIISVTKNIILPQNVPTGYIAEVEQLTLTIMVYGPETFIDVLDEADIVPYVDCSDLEGGDYSLPIEVSLPPNIVRMNVSVDTASVTIIAPEEETEEEIILQANNSSVSFNE